MDNDQPITLIIFGASGDLTERKLIPALFSSFRKERLPAFNVVGFARRDWSHDDFRQHLRAGFEKFAPDLFDEAAWDTFSQRLWYSRGDLNNPNDYETLRAFLGELENGPANRLYYLATAPNFFVPIVNSLGGAGLVRERDHGWRHVVIEKPFGHDLDSARELNDAIHQVFREHQVYRIDHYLGKETAQNILYLRFANTIFEPVWNRNYVDNVQITVAESVDIGHRAGYYDQAGVVRDMFQNHLLQLLALVAMEPPASFAADAVRNERVKLLASIRPISLADTVRAQYQGYLETEGVAADSQTPTFAALVLYVDNWRWQGVPFYLRSGKALAKKNTEIVIQFRKPPHLMFKGLDDEDFDANALSICIQPDEGIHLQFEAKIPDKAEADSVDMEFHYRSSFKGDSLPDAYERLLLDAIRGDASLFTRSDSIEAAWKLMDPILAGWEGAAAPPMVYYEPGSWGPAAAERLLGENGRFWRHGCVHD
jgi:glucose-6-phosphate 1-dehydrogenase